MAKKNVTIKLSENAIALLEKISKEENRSQGGEIEHLIIKEAKVLNIQAEKK